MKMWQANVLNELQIIFYQRKTRLIFLLISLMPIGFVFLMDYIGSYMDVGTTVLGLLTTLILPCLIMMIAADMFTNEMTTGTMKLTLTRPISRFKVFTSKVTAMGIVILTVTLVIWLITQLVYLFLQSNWSVANMVDHLLIYIVSLFPMFVVALFAICMGQLFRSATGTVVISIMIYALCKLVPFVLPAWGNFLFTNYTDWYTLWLAESLPWNQLASISLTIFASGFVFWSAGWFLFEQKEIS